jgi:ribosomal protein S18 acetylase RimI-like enzyme
MESGDRDLITMSEEKIIVRDATPEDIEGILRVQKETWLATYPNEAHGITLEDIKNRDWDNPEKVERWKQSLQNSEIHVWVAEDSGAIVGFCNGNKTDGEHRLRAIYVLPEAQGKGIGSRLAEQCFAWLGNEKEILVDVVSYNEQAISFYKKLGFEGNDLVLETELFVLPSGIKLPEIRMKKHI